METFLGLLATQFEALSVTELIAVVAAVLYLVLAIRQNILCWFFAAASTAIYVALFIDAKLYMESLLNAFYFVMAIYGFWFWLARGKDASGPAVIRWSVRRHAAAILSIAVLSFAAGWFLRENTDAAYPFADSMTTFSAFWATFLVARKVLENWWYWLVIDSVSIYLYWTRGLELTALLFAAYVVMIPIGLVAWTRASREQPALAAP